MKRRVRTQEEGGEESEDPGQETNKREEEYISGESERNVRLKREGSVEGTDRGSFTLSNSICHTL